ncbi:MAG: hypothetical protein A2546_14180 [Sphingobacteriia bacterium RIFOXYD2_FULL_35_12]|nr:MAG: hypothetical protein A2472_14790 [Sphingobacteriia bacterium RIFOXYC2_FULL_35_18]OHC88025.1 MAG: hypothetical protein A2546_14180 [Sphingobacteriia bacterium RIFOXYD2_FULL_35_12]
MIPNRYANSKQYLKINIAVFLIYFFSLSCQNEVDDAKWVNQMPPYPDSLTLQKISSKELLLDSSTILKYENFQYIENENSILSYNSLNSELVCFDYTSGELKWKIDLKIFKIRPRNKGTIKPYSFHAISYDSIFFYDNIRSKVILFDTAKNVLKEYVVASKMNSYSKGNPVMGEDLAVSSDSIYISSSPGGRNTSMMESPLNNNLFLSISIKDGNSKPIIRYPKIYRKAVWGTYSHISYSTYNPNHNKLVISFPIDHNLSVYKTNGEIELHYAGSIHVSKVNPLFFSAGNNIIKQKDEILNTLTQRSYKAILYDKYRNAYYRFVSSSIPKRDYELSQSSDYKVEPMSVIILNSDLIKVGEVPLDANKYSLISMFISKEGVCIPLKKSNDDVIYFDVFKIIRK